MRYYSDTCPATTLAAGMDTVTTSMETTVAVHSYFSGFPFVLRIDAGLAGEELVRVLSGAGTSGSPYIVERGWGSSGPATHSSGAAVAHAVGSLDIQESRAHEDATTSVHGISNVSELFLKPVTADKIIYVSPRGNDSNDGRSWASAKLTVVGGLAALSGPGTIMLGAGAISTGGQINLDGRTGVTIQGLGSATAGASPTTVVTHSGSGSAAVITARSSIGCKFRSFMLLYSNAGFTGDVIDLRLTGVSTALWEIYDMYIGGAGVSGARSNINVGNAQDGMIQQCNIVGSQVGILGRAVSGDFSTAIVVSRCRFALAATYSIKNVGSGWTITGCNFAAVAGGKAGSIFNDPGIVAQGIIVAGNWFGDVTAAAGGAQISAEVTGLVVTGNFIGFNTTATGVAVGNNSSSVRINGNSFESGNSGDTGISLGTGCSDWDLTGNSFVSVATKISAGSIAQYRSPTDLTAAYAWQTASGVAVLTANTANARVGVVTAAPNSALHVNGPIATAYQTATGAMTLGTSNSIVGASAASPYTITLPSASTIGGREYTVTKTDNNANTITIAAAGGESINGAATYTGLNAQWKTVTLYSNGSSLWIIKYSN